MKPDTVSEAYIEKKLKEKLKSIFGLLFLYLKFKAPGFNGVPDRLILLPGKQIYFVELKKPKGGSLSPVQVVVHKLFAALGFKVYVIWTIEQLDNFILEVSI